MPGLKQVATVHEFGSADGIISVDAKPGAVEASFYKCRRVCWAEVVERSLFLDIYVFCGHSYYVNLPKSLDLSVGAEGYPSRKVGLKSTEAHFQAFYAEAAVRNDGRIP